MYLGFTMLFLCYNSILVSVIIYKTLIKTCDVCKLTQMNVDNNLDGSENKQRMADNGSENKQKMDDNGIEIDIISLVDECVIQQLECHCCLIDENLITCI